MSEFLHELFCFELLVYSYVYIRFYSPYDIRAEVTNITLLESD